jgi:two-component system CheB/CheR fusion protein
MRILVVDDCPDTARMMRVLLRGQGYEVKIASTGREAIESARIFRPAVMLIDLVLPDLTGAEVASELRTVVGLEKTSLIAISGYDSERIPAIFDGHFIKPVDHDALDRFLSRVADRGTAGPAS